MDVEGWKMSTANTVREKYELGFMRILDAPVERVWRAWAEPEFFQLWWGPQSFTSHHNKIDFHIGGKFLWNIRSPEGSDIYSTGIYREVIPLKRIVMQRSFADKNGNIVPASHYQLFGDWPTVTIITVTFESLNTKTRMTVHESGIPEDAKEQAVED